MAIRHASARWTGTLPEGSGTLRTGKGGYEGPYSFSSRFEEGQGANPEELIGAALSGCFSMALSKALTDGGYPPTSVETSAQVHFDKGEAGWSITRVELDTAGDVPGIDEGTFVQTAEQAKANCPVSRLLSPGTEITLKARLA